MRRFRLFAATCAVATVLFAFSCYDAGLHAVLATDARAPESPASPYSGENSVDLAKLYDAVIETIEKKFFDGALLKRLDWRARANDLRPLVVSARTEQDAVRQINALLAELKTSHTALLTPDEYDYYALLDF